MRTTITVYNRYFSKSASYWYPTVIPNVDIVIDKASVVEKYGENSKDSAVIHIPFKRDGFDMYVADKLYLTPKLWSKQLNDELPDSVTFNENAQKFDFFVLGEHSTAPINDDDYNDGFYNYMNTTEDYCYAITSVGTYESITGLLRHFVILAK